jgi:hypothetical protein
LASFIFVCKWIFRFDACFFCQPLFGFVHFPFVIDFFFVIPFFWSSVYKFPCFSCFI